MKTLVSSLPAPLAIPGLTMVREIKATFKQSGFRGLHKRYGWKILAGIFAYYLVRDVTLYVIIPYVAWNLF